MSGLADADFPICTGETTAVWESLEWRRWLLVVETRGETN
jgi:hypothetical protein